MDPWAPINGISLERYAELAADVSDTQDPAKQAEIVGQKGIGAADWEAAKSGWTARMQDMSLMGQVATRFMPMYQAALSRKSPTPQISYEDYVAICGCPPVIGIEGTLAHYKITMTQWTQIAGHWNGIIATNPQYMQHGLRVEQEAARIRAGGAPRPIAMGGGAPSPAPAQPESATHAVSGAMPGAVPPPGYGVAPAQHGYAAQPGYPHPPAPGYPQQQAWPQQQPGYHQQAGYNQQAVAFGNQVGSAFSAFGNALGSFVNGAITPLAPGSAVMVQWSDGQRYPATVMLMQNNQVQVAFPDGRQVWVPQQFVTPR